MEASLPHPHPHYYALMFDHLTNFPGFRRTWVEVLPVGGENILYIQPRALKYKYNDLQLDGKARRKAGMILNWSTFSPEQRIIMAKQDKLATFCTIS